MEEEARVEISLENRYKEALRKAKEVREYIKERNDTRELDVAEWLAYDMRYVEEYVRQLEEENKKKDKRLNRQFKLLQKKDKETEELKADNNHQWEERCKLTFELDDSIPKSKVKEKTEEIKLSLKDDCIALHEFQRIAKIDVLQELLES